MIKKTLIVAAFLSVFGSAMAQRTGFYSDGRPERLFYPVSGLDNRDMSFLKNAQASNEFEILSSQLAVTNSESEFVKQFAKNMIDDHTASKAEVSQVAGHKGINIGTQLPGPLQSKLNKLRNLHGSSFDKLYKELQMNGHEKTIALFKSEIEHGHDQDVKALAVKGLPTVELHMKLMMSGKTETGATAATHGE